MFHWNVQDPSIQIVFTFNQKNGPSPLGWPFLNGQLERQGYYLFEFETVLALKRVGKVDFGGNNQYTSVSGIYRGKVLER